MTTSSAQDNLAVYFRGERLYGDDFTDLQVAEWFEDEREGYADLGAAAVDPVGDAAEHEYGYRALNRRHGFRHLPERIARRGASILSVGGSYGTELLPVAEGANRIVVLEPSAALRSATVAGVTVEYATPRPDGTMPFPGKSFDLITSFGALHHIANVSKVVGEMFRCSRTSGYALIREPITSMGDWRRHRPGLTKHERGIPLRLFREIVTEAGFEIVRETPCMFSLTSRVRYILRGSAPYQLSWVVLADQVVSRLSAWNQRYHRTTVPQKLGPSSVFLVLRRP
jgi:SAM-dependent methyltransferase